MLQGNPLRASATCAVQEQKARCRARQGVDSHKVRVAIRSRQMTGRTPAKQSGKACANQREQGITLVVGRGVDVNVEEQLGGQQRSGRLLGCLLQRRSCASAGGPHALPGGLRRR